MKTVWVASATYADDDGLSDTIIAAGVTKELAEAALEEAVREYCIDCGANADEDYFDEEQYDLWTQTGAHEIPINGS